MKLHLLTPLILFAMAPVAHALNQAQQRLFEKTVEVATNDLINEIENQIITHQEQNRLLEIIRDENLGAKDLIGVIEAVRLASALSDEQRIDARIVLSNILSVRLRMDEYLAAYRQFRCVWRIREDPRQTVEPDSPLAGAFGKYFVEGSKERIQPIREWERVVVGVCGTLRRP